MTLTPSNFPVPDETREGAPSTAPSLDPYDFNHVTGPGPSPLLTAGGGPPANDPASGGRFHQPSLPHGSVPRWTIRAKKARPLRGDVYLERTSAAAWAVWPGNVRLRPRTSSPFQHRVPPPRGSHQRTLGLIFEKYFSSLSNVQGRELWGIGTTNVVEMKPLEEQCLSLRSCAWPVQADFNGAGLCAAKCPCCCLMRLQQRGDWRPEWKPRAGGNGLLRRSLEPELASQQRVSRAAKPQECGVLSRRRKEQATHLNARRPSPACTPRRWVWSVQKPT